VTSHVGEGKESTFSKWEKGRTKSTASLPARKALRNHGMEVGKRGGVNHVCRGTSAAKYLQVREAKRELRKLASESCAGALEDVKLKAGAGSQLGGKKFVWGKKRIF